MESIYINYLEFFPSGDLSLPPHLFIYSIIFFIPVWTHGYLFYIFILGYNSMLYYLLGCSVFFFSSFSQWKPIQVGSCIPLICSSFNFFVLFLIFWYYIRCSGLIFPAPALESTISPWNFHSFYWGVGLKNQGLGAGCSLDLLKAQTPSLSYTNLLFSTFPIKHLQSNTVVCHQLKVASQATIFPSPWYN